MLRLYDYYGCAICKHAGDVGAMSNTIWTILQMTLMQSEDDDRIRRTEPSSEDHTTTVINQWLGRKKSQWANGPMLPQINGPFQISVGHGIKCMGHQWVSISKPV